MTNSGDVGHKALRGVAAGAGFLGGLLGVLGFGAAIAGDKYLTDGTVVAGVAVLAAIALAGAAVAWWRPILAAIAMLLAVAGYWYAVAGPWGSFWSDYQTAINTSPAAENDFWSSGVLAVPSLALAVPFLAIGCVIAVLGHNWSRASRPRSAATS